MCYFTHSCIVYLDKLLQSSLQPRENKNKYLMLIYETIMEKNSTNSLKLFLNPAEFLSSRSLTKDSTKTNMYTRGMQSKIVTPYYFGCILFVLFLHSCKCYWTVCSNILHHWPYKYWEKVYH